MKTIDTKSLLLGVGITILYLTLTSGKTSTENDNLMLSSVENRVVVFNKQTKILYTYPSNFGRIAEKPFNSYQISNDGSSLTKMDNE